MDNDFNKMKSNFSEIEIAIKNFEMSVLQNCENLKERYKKYGVISVGIFMNYDGLYMIKVAVKDTDDNGPLWLSFRQLENINESLYNEILELETLLNSASSLLNFKNILFNMVMP